MAVLSGAMTGHARYGLALGAGLLLGCLNAPLARRALDSEFGFRSTSLARLTLLTVAALAVGALLGWGLAAALVIAGVGLAQIALAATAAREALRA